MNSRKIREFVLKLGITPDLLGYEYIISAIELMAKEYHKSMMKVYEQVAEIHNTTRTRVERAIKHAITSILISPYGYELLSNAFNCEFSSDYLPNSKFLALCVEAIKYDWQEARRC